MAKRGYRRINCGILVNPEEHKFVDGKIEFHPEFINRYNDWKGWFESEFEQMVAEAFGEEGWALFFTQVTQHEPNFFVDIYLDDVNSLVDYAELAVFTTNHLMSKGIRCTSFLRGTIQDYIAGR